MGRCSLCGSRLDLQKRCTFCGLDNTKNDSMYKHMINKNKCENEPLTHVHEEPARPRPIKSSASIPAQNNRTYTTPQYRDENRPAKVKKPAVKMEKGDKKPVGCSAFLSVIPFIIALLGLIGNIAGDIFSGFGEAEPDYYYEENVGYDPYAWVIDEMPEDGDAYSTYLDAGIYEVGYHIPMGIYQINASAGTNGTVEVYDEWNEIYLSEFLDAHSDSYTLYDVQLYDGAYLVIYSGMEVTLFTENAQLMNVSGTLAESKEAIELGGRLEAGVDFEAGAYDIIYQPEVGEDSFVSIMVMPEDKDYGFYITFDSAIEGETFYNVPIPEGAVIVVDEPYLEGVEDLYMVPSESTSDSDLNNFYYAY